MVFGEILVNNRTNFGTSSVFLEYRRNTKNYKNVHPYLFKKQKQTTTIKTNKHDITVLSSDFGNSFSSTLMK